MNTIYVSLMIFFNVALLVILVPGGPIENRDFSHLKGIVFWGFNIFLIGLGILSFYAEYAVLAHNDHAASITKFIAIGFFIVYVLDLAKIFPKSPTKMSNKLLFIELINICMSLHLFILAQFI